MLSIPPKRTATGTALIEDMGQASTGDPTSDVPFDVVAPPYVKRDVGLADLEAHGDAVWRRR